MAMRLATGEKKGVKNATAMATPWAVPEVCSFFFSQRRTLEACDRASDAARAASRKATKRKKQKSPWGQTHGPPIGSRPAAQKRKATKKDKERARTPEAQRPARAASSHKIAPASSEPLSFFLSSLTFGVARVRISALLTVCLFLL
jgi:hypothetical protein